MRGSDTEVVTCVVVGNSAVGKSSLLIAYTEGRFPHEYCPTLYDSGVHDMVVDGRCVRLEYHDSVGGESRYDAIRVRKYVGADVVIVCFSVVNPLSFDSVRAKWVGDVREHLMDTPILLVGTKRDLRFDSGVLADCAKVGFSPFTQEDGEHLAREIGAALYLESSALTCEGVSEVFEDAVRIVLNRRQAANTKAKCAVQ